MRRALVGEGKTACHGLEELSTDCKVDLGHFQELLKEIDNTLRSLPATGQVSLLCLLWVLHNQHLKVETRLLSTSHLSKLLLFCCGCMC